MEKQKFDRREGERRKDVEGSRKYLGMERRLGERRRFQRGIPSDKHLPFLERHIVKIP